MKSKNLLFLALFCIVTTMSPKAFSKDSYVQNPMIGQTITIKSAMIIIDAPFVLHRSRKAQEIGNFAITLQESYGCAGCSAVFTEGEIIKVLPEGSEVKIIQAFESEPSIEYRLYGSTVQLYFIAEFKGLIFVMSHHALMNAGLPLEQSPFTVKKNNDLLMSFAHHEEKKSFGMGMQRVVMMDHEPCTTESLSVYYRRILAGLKTYQSHAEIMPQFCSMNLTLTQRGLAFVILAGQDLSSTLGASETEPQN